MALMTDYLLTLHSIVFFVLIPITNLAACTNSSVFFSLFPANTISILEKKYFFLTFDLAYQLFMCFFTTLDVAGSGQL